MAIRPEALTFEGGANKIGISGKVVRSSMLGSVTRYQIDCGSNTINLELVNHDTRRLQLGEKVTVYANEKNVLYINE